MDTGDFFSGTNIPPGPHEISENFADSGTNVPPDREALPDRRTRKKKKTPSFGKNRKRRHKRPRTAASPNKVGWRISEWCDDLGFSKAYFYASLINEVETVKIGYMTIILTSPKEYIARKKAQQAQAAD